MSAPYHKILSKCERAVVAYLIAQGAGTATDTLPGKNSNVKTLPITIVWAKHWEVDPPHSREFMVTVSILCKVSAPADVGDTAAARRLASDSRLGPVFGSFTEPDPNNATDIPEAINAAALDASIADPDNNADLADFTCIAIAGQSGDADANEKGDVWEDSMDLILRCSPYAI